MCGWGRREIKDLELSEQNIEPQTSWTGVTDAPETRKTFN